MKKLFLILFLLFFSFSGEVLASSAKSVVETQVESSGETQVYQYVETTVDGETVKKESREPGKLELEMKKTGEGEPTVTFSQEEIFPTQTPIAEARKPISFISQIIEFFRGLVRGLTDWFK